MEQTNINSNLEFGKKLLNEVKTRSKPLSLNEINKQAYDRLKARESISYKDLAEYEFSKLDEKAKSETSFEVFAESFKNSLNVSNLPYVGNVIDGMNFQKLNDITLKAYKGQELNQEEVAIYDKYVNELKKDKVYQGRNSYAIGSGIVPSIKYSAEYALNTAVLGYATGGVGIVAGSLATALEPTRLYREYQARQLKGDLNITDKGEVFFGELQKDPVKTLFKSYAKSVASDFSEKLGDKLFDNAITSKISNSLTGFKKSIFDILVGSAQKSNKGGFTGNVLNSIQSTFNGVLGENIEEYIEEPLSQLLGANDNEYTIENLLKSLEAPTMDELLITNGVLVFQGGISKAGYSMVNKLAKSGATQEQVEQYVNNTTEEQFEKDKKKLNQADKEQLKNIVNKYTEQLKAIGMNEQEVEVNNTLLDKILTYGYTNLNPDELSVDEYYSKNLMFDLKKIQKFNRTKGLEKIKTESELIDFINKGLLPEFIQSQGKDKLEKQDLLDIYKSIKNAKATINKTKSTSLIQWLQANGGLYDVGGDLKSQDLNKKFRGLVKSQQFQKRKNRKTGEVETIDSSIDNQFKKAIEEGFFPEIQDYRDVDGVNTLLDAINEEVSGNIRYSSNSQDNAEKVDYLNEYISQLEEAGIDINELEYLKNFGKNKGTLNQEGQIKTESEAFKKWFGDSKVVDKDGKPLVVYHGTNRQFDTFKKSEKIHGDVSGDGFYFTDNISRSKKFISLFGSEKIDNNDKRLIKTFISIKNPYYLEKGRPNVEELKKKGFDGIIIKRKDGIVDYVVFEPTQIKSVDNKGTFSLEDPNIYNQQQQADIKGQYDPVKRLITLSEISDASTFQHEVMHWWRQFLGEQANNGNSLAQQDLNTLNTFVGAENNNWNTTQQEKFARAWEQYLRRGIAPTRELKNTFEKLRDWFTTIYNSFKDIKVDGKAIVLSKDIIDYFDTILTDEVLNKDLEFEKEKLQQEMEQENQELLNQEVSPEEINIILEDKYGARLRNIEEQIAKSKQTSEQEYQNYKKSIKEFNDKKLSMSANDFKKKSFNYLSNIFFSENQKIREQSEVIYQKYLQSDFAKKQQILNIEKQTENFVNKTSEIIKQNKEDYEKMSIAWYNNDLQTIAELSTKYGIYEDFLNVRASLEDLYYKQLEVGIDVPYRENYLPTRIKSGNFDKVMALIESKVNTEVFNDINNKILELGLTDEKTKLAFVNNYLRGFVPNAILLSPTNFTKRRTLERSAEFYPYYDDFLNSYKDYVVGTINNIEDRIFFGKGKKEQQKTITDLKRKQKSLLELEQTPAGKIKKNEIYRLEFEKKGAELKLKEYNSLLKSGKQSITKKDGTTIDLQQEVNNLNERINALNESLKYTENASPFALLNNRKNQVKNEIDLLKEQLKDTENLDNSIAKFIMQETNLNNEQQKQLVDLLKSLFNKKATGKFTQTSNTLSGIYVLSNFKSAFKQLSELANSIYKNNFGNTLTALFEKQVSIEDFGLDSRWNLENPSVLNKIYDNSLKLVGFDKFDMLGKNTFINASLLKAQKLALDNNAEFSKKLEVMFQEKAEAVKEDFKNKKISYDVLSYLFSEINNVQPITDGAKTKFYNDNPAIRFAYNLKGYMVQQLSLVKNDIINEALKGNYKTATRNLFYLQTALWLTGIPISYISHFLFDDDDEEFTITDAMVDNIILNNIINRFNMAKAGSGKILDIFKSMVTPAIFRPMQNILDDLFGIFNGNFENKTIKKSGIVKNLPEKVKPEFLKE